MHKSILNLFLFTLLFSFGAISQTPKADSLLAIAKSANHDSTRFNAYFKLGDYYQGINYDSAIHYHLKAKATASLYKNIIGEGKATTGAGWDYYSKGDMNNALKLYKNALAISELTIKNAKNKNEIKDAELFKSSCLLIIGIVYHNRANYPLALEYYLKVLHMNEKHENKIGISTMYSNIGSLYFDQGEYTNSYKYYLKAINIAKEINNQRAIAYEFGNIGILFGKQKDEDFVKEGLNPRDRFKLALDYFTDCLNLYESLGGPPAIWLANKGVIYKQIFEKKGISTPDSSCNKALEYFNEALRLSRNAGAKSEEANWLLYIGDIYITINKKNVAEKLLLLSLKISQEAEAKTTELEDYHLLSKLYEKQNQSDKALKYYKNYVTLRDSINNEESIKKQSRLEAEFEWEKKLAIEKAEQEKKDVLVAEEKQKQKIILWSVIAGLILIAMFSVFIYNRFRITRKQKNIIEKQKKEVDNKNFEIAAKNDALNQQNEEIKAQRDEIEQQKEKIEEKQKEIIDSINYAKRIQKALMPNDSFFRKHLNKR